MTRKPSEDLRQLFEVAKQQPTKTAGYEVADRTVASIAWMLGYIRRVQEAIDTGDHQTFVDARKELVSAKTELAALTNLLQEILKWLAQQ